MEGGVKLIGQIPQEIEKCLLGYPHTSPARLFYFSSLSLPTHHCPPFFFFFFEKEEKKKKDRLNSVFSHP